MRVTSFFDVLSHWCLAATPALLALEQSLADDLHVEVIIAPIADGGRIGFHPESRRWAFRRGSLAYGTSLTSDWYENEESCTWHANAATAAAIELGASPVALVCAVSRSAMIDGALLAREQEAVRHIATLANLPEDRLHETMRHDDFKVRVSERCEEVRLASGVRDSRRADERDAALVAKSFFWEFIPPPPFPAVKLPESKWPLMSRLCV